MAHISFPGPLVRQPLWSLVRSAHRCRPRARTISSALQRSERASEREAVPQQFRLQQAPPPRVGVQDLRALPDVVLPRSRPFLPGGADPYEDWVRAAKAVGLRLQSPPCCWKLPEAQAALRNALRAEEWLEPTAWQLMLFHLTQVKAVHAYTGFICSEFNGLERGAKAYAPVTRDDAASLLASVPWLLACERPDQVGADLLHMRDSAVRIAAEFEQAKVSTTVPLHKPMWWLRQHALAQKLLVAPPRRQEAFLKSFRKLSALFGIKFASRLLQSEQGVASVEKGLDPAAEPAIMSIARRLQTPAFPVYEVILAYPQVLDDPDASAGWISNTTDCVSMLNPEVWTAARVLDWMLDAPEECPAGQQLLFDFKSAEQSTSIHAAVLACLKLKPRRLSLAIVYKPWLFFRIHSPSVPVKWALVRALADLHPEWAEDLRLFKKQPKESLADPHRDYFLGVLAAAPRQILRLAFLHTQPRLFAQHVVMHEAHMAERKVLMKKAKSDLRKKVQFLDVGCYMIWVLRSVEEFESGLLQGDPRLVALWRSGSWKADLTPDLQALVHEVDKLHDAGVDPLAGVHDAQGVFTGLQTFEAFQAQYSRAFNRDRLPTRGIDRGHYL